MKLCVKIYFVKWEAIASVMFIIHNVLYTLFCAGNSWFLSYLHRQWIMQTTSIYVTL